MYYTWQRGASRIGLDYMGHEDRKQDAIICNSPCLCWKKEVLIPYGAADDPGDIFDDRFPGYSCTLSSKRNLSLFVEAIQ